MFHGLNLNDSPRHYAFDSIIFRDMVLCGAGPWVGWDKNAFPPINNGYPPHIADPAVPGSPAGPAVLPTGLGLVIADQYLRLSYTGTGAVSVTGGFGGSPYNDLDNTPGGADAAQVGGASRDVAFLNVQFQDPGPGQITVRITKSLASDPVRDVKLEFKGGSDPTFYQPFLDNVARFTALRFMDWGGINAQANEWRNWGDQDMPGLTFAEQNWIHYKYWWALCNATGKDCWVNIPALASEDYCRQMGAYFATHLDPGIRLYVENSNETWNFSFQQWQAQLTAHDDGTDPDPDKPATGAWEYIDYRAGRATKWFREAALAADPDRDLLIVLAEQAGYYATLDTAVTIWNQHNFIFDAIALAPYIEPSDPWKDTRFDQAARYATDPAGTMADLMANILGDGLARSMEWVDVWVSRAAGYHDRDGNLGVPVYFYEGGDGVVEPYQDALTNMYVACHRDPRWYDVLAKYIDETKDRIALNMWYFNVGGISKFGGWGLQEYTGQPDEDDFPLWFPSQNPTPAYKHRAVLDAIAADSGGLLAGAVDGSATSGTTASLTATAPTGGTAPYAGVWLRDGSPIALAPAWDADHMTLVDGGLVPGTTYRYAVRYRDSATPTPVSTTSPGKSITTPGGGGGGGGGASAFAIARVAGLRRVRRGA
jgi:hypothetical protein